jgi:hypothetical protein
MKPGEAVAVIRKNGGTHVSWVGRFRIGDPGEVRGKDTWWELRDYDTVLHLWEVKGELKSLEYCTKDDFSKKRPERSIKTLRLYPATKRIGVESVE